MRGRLSEALGRDKDALAQYEEAMASPDREAAAEAQIHDIALRQKRNEIKQEEALRDLETLSVMWRGDGLEVQTLKMLMALYTDTGRYAEALAVVKDRHRAATGLRSVAPNSGQRVGAVRPALPRRQR